MHGPCVPPEKRPSVMSATFVPSPIPMIAEVGESISRIPGPPFGPSYRMTTIIPGLILPAMIAAMAVSSEPNTLAFPRKRNIEGSTPDCLMTAPPGARLPVRMAIPPSGRTGASRRRMIPSESTRPLRAIFVMSSPDTVGFFLSMGSSRLRTAGIPPENSTSSIMCGPAGVTVVSCGVSRESRSNSFRGSGTLASWAMASRCRTELEDPPRAMSTRTAFSNAARVRIFRGVIPFRTSRTIRRPVA